jgi:hypothetical protein
VAEVWLPETPINVFLVCLGSWGMGLRFELDIDEVVVCLKNAVVRAVSEEDVRVWVRSVLRIRCWLLWVLWVLGGMSIHYFRCQG